jgi:5-methylcytosine-specific restriction endonuclease McrA
MTTDKNKRLDDLVAQSKKYQADREQTYRERSLKMYPWVCGRCSREFTQVNLQELTVHHRDHNHDNNPNDGSNWELLCVYCHDNEHSRYIEQVRYGSAGADTAKTTTTHNPFAALGNLLKNKD